MMKDLFNRNNVVFALGLGAVGVAAGIAACGGSSNGGAASNDGNAGASGGNASDDGGVTTASGDDGGISPIVDAGHVSTQTGSCPNPTVPIVFSPMYSAFIPGSTAQTFSVPAVTGDGNAATWSLSDSTQGHLQLQSFGSGNALLPGVLITFEGIGNDAGQLSIIADEGNGVCGASVIKLTQNTEDDWSIGNSRYNDGVAIHIVGFRAGDGGPPGGGNGRPPDGGFEGGGQPPVDAGSRYETEGGTACTNCHGPTATNGPYKTVSHTPEQTGGFSDMDLQNIIWDGVVPDGGYFDPTVLLPNCDGGSTCTQQARALWHSFHRWTDITSDELPGVICYLRSLTPQSQNGTSNFGGRGVRPDGGARRDGGR